ncbi:MAG: DUF5666 domain-containing protein [Patescibacteria group bacterium]
MKKIFTIVLISMFSFMLVAPALAQNTEHAKIKPAKLVAAAKFTRRAVTLTGKIVSLAGTTAPTSMVITVNKVLPKKLKNWTGAYPTSTQNLTIQITSTTRVIREFYAKSGLSELQIGDAVSVIAKTNQDGTVTAQLVKDNSIHVFSRTGKIVSIDTASGSFVFAYGKHNATVVTVKTDANTKFKVAKVTNPTLSNFTVSSTVAVSGLINSNTKTVYTAKTVRLIKQ